MISKPASVNQQGFGTGLVLGSLLGIAAYFLYGTKEGSKARDQLLHDFHRTKTLVNSRLQHLHEQASVITAPAPPPISTGFAGFVNQLAAKLTPPASSARDDIQTKSTAKSPPADKHSPKKQYFTRLGRHLPKTRH